MKTTNELPCLARNIRYYRKQNSLSIATLANKIGMTEAHFGRIERGLNIPSAAVVAQIASILYIPVENFFENSDHNSFSTIHFRGNENFSLELKEKIYKIIKIYSSLENICQASTYRSFPLDIPMKSFSKGDIHEAAQIVRELFGIRYAITFNLFDLFDNNGLKTIIVNLPANIPAFSYYDIKANSVTFFINSTITDEKKKYALIHELGHLIFHQGSLKHCTPFKPFSDPNNTFDLENISNSFASCFLIPEKCLKSLIKQTGITKTDWTYDFLIRIKNRFGVSSDFFLERLHELNLIEEENFLKINRFIKKNNKISNNIEPCKKGATMTYNTRLWDLVELAFKKEKKKIILKYIDQLTSLGVIK